MSFFTDAVDVLRIVPVILIGNRISQKFYTKKQPQTD